MADTGHVEHNWLRGSLGDSRRKGRRLVGGVALARQEQTAGGEEPREDTTSIAFPERESAAHDGTVLVVERGGYPVAEFLCPGAPAVKSGALWVNIGGKAWILQRGTRQSSGAC